MTGSIDGLLSDLAGRTWLWEHKALATYSFERYWAENPLNYFTQVALYLHGLAGAGWEQVTEALLTIKNKNTSDYIEFRLRYDREHDILELIEVIRASTEEQRVNQEQPTAVFRGLRRQALDRFLLVEQHRAAGTLPERPYPEPTRFPCGYCPYRQRCWQDWTPKPLNGRKEQERSR